MKIFSFFKKTFKENPITVEAPQQGDATYYGPDFELTPEILEKLLEESKSLEELERRIKSGEVDEGIIFDGPGTPVDFY